MRKWLSNIANFINYQIDSEEYKKREKTTIQMSALMMVFVTCLLAVINMRNLNDANIAPASVIGVLMFVVAGVCAVFFYNDSIIRSMIFMGFIMLFTFILLEGATNGSAIYWILIIPFAYLAIINFRGGLALGTYFMVLSILVFYTPLKDSLPYQYPEEVSSRFPVMYIACFALAIVIGAQHKKALIEDYHRQLSLQAALAEEKKKSQIISLEAITSITNALDAKDAYTYRHSEHVAYYSKEIGRAYGLSDDQLDELYTAARMHDLGKIGIPDAILNKRSGLTPEEYEIMKSHVEVGANILSAFDTMPSIGVGALYHHERYDGNGYLGLNGANIPLPARIIAVADAMDAMYTTRIYREKSTKYNVIEQIRYGRGTQFDPMFADLAIRLIEDGMLERMEEEFGES